MESASLRFFSKKSSLKSKTCFSVADIVHKVTAALSVLLKNETDKINLN